MYYIGNVQLDLAVLNPESLTGGKNYKGSDEIQTMIALKWQELYDRYSKNGTKTITFIRPHIKSGVGPGSMGGSYPRRSTVHTRNGTKVVTWCDSAMETGHNTYEFKPSHFKHTPEQPLMLNMDTDIEQILWHCLFDALAKQTYTFPQKDPGGKPHPKAGETVPRVSILDPEDEAAAFLRNGMRSADMWYYLQSPTSPIIRNRTVINTLASAWGVVKPETVSDALVRQMLIQAIEAADKRGDADYGYEGFSKAVRSVVEKEDTTRLETLALINQAVDRGIVSYNQNKLGWFLMAESGQPMKRLCQVPSVSIGKEREVLMAHLIRDEDDLTLVQGSVEAKPLKEKLARKVYIPKDVTADFFLKRESEGGMKMARIKSCCSILGFPSFKKNRDELAELLVDHFITKGLSLPPENLAETVDEERGASGE